MILTKQIESQVLTEGATQESIDMSLDLDSAQVLMQMLSKNLYSDEIGSTVRELASNALDSHRRAGVSKPIIVTFKMNKDDNYEFTVEDFGVGLDDNDVRNIISKYGKSLARTEEFALGMMGLGFKAPLAYSSSFYFIARKDGIERKYMMYEGEEGNKIDLLHQKNTTEHDGVKVIVPVKYNDRLNFISKIKEQLAYFEDVYFDVPSLSSSYYNNNNTGGISNDFKIYRGEDYQYSQLASDTSLHICLDNVYYPIDWLKLGIQKIDLPVGLRFTLKDGIFPVPSREALRYTKEAKDTIINKIKKVSEYFINKYNETVTVEANINDIFQYYNSSYRYIRLSNTDPAGKLCDISSLIRYSTVPFTEPKLKGVELLDLRRITMVKDHILDEYRVVYESTRHKMKEVKSAYERVNIGSVNNLSYYIFSERMAGNKREYLKSLFDYSGTYYLIKKIKIRRLFSSGYGDDSSYCSVLELRKYPRETWRARIKEFQYITSLFTSKFIDADKIEISQSWLDDRKKERLSISDGSTRRVKLQGEIVGKLAQPLERYVDGRYCKFVPETFKFENIHKIPALVVYTNHDNNDSLNNLYSVCNNNKLRCITFSDREIKNLEKIKIHNLISYKEFMEGNNKPFKRMITAYLINKLMNEQNFVFGRVDQLTNISTSLRDKLIKLRDYRSQFYYNSNNEIYKAMLEVAEEHNLFDMDIYHLYVEINDLLKRLPFVNSVMKVMNQYGKDDAMNKVLCDLFKYYKYRINYENYAVVVNDTSWMDEILTDEKVDSLAESIEED